MSEIEKLVEELLAEHEVETSPEYKEHFNQVEELRAELRAEFEKAFSLLSMEGLNHFIELFRSFNDSSPF